MQVTATRKNTVFNILFVWGIVVFHIYVLLSKPCASSTVPIRLSAGSETSGGCPIKMMKNFFSQHTLWSTNSMLTIATHSRTATGVLNARGSYVKSTDLRALNGARGRHFVEYRRQQPFSVLPSADDVNFFRLFATTEETKVVEAPSQQQQVLDSSVSLQQQEQAADGEGKKDSKKKKKSSGSDALEVIVLGLSHHNAKVEVREKLAIPEDDWNAASEMLAEYPSIGEAAVLSTCNRFEIYLAGKNQYEVMRDAIDFLYQRAEGQLDLRTLRQNLFMLSGEDAIWHLLRVSAGLDSLVVGEGQILAQVKRAYEHSIDNSGQGGKVISRLLNVAVSSGKRVRSETGISKGAVSISSAAAEFTATKLSSDCGVDSMSEANIAIIGAGKMARLLLIHLQTQGLRRVTIVNRSMQRALELQQEFPDLQMDIKLMPEMWAAIEHADVVYPSTGATSTIIDPAPLQQALSARSRPGGLQFVDISVPRNVHPDCEQLPGVHCYNVDDLKAVVQRNTAKRRREMLEAELILKEEQDKFRLWQQSLGAIPTIAKLQEKAEMLRTEEMKKAARKLSQLSDKDLEVVNKVTKGIVAKLLHGPMNHLRQQTEGDATRAAIEQLQRAFQLEEQ